MLLRLTLSLSFLSAVADRFGLWGLPGAPAVVWGNFENFVSYTATLNWFLPASVIPTLAWVATALEVVLGALLLLGVRLKETAAVSAALLATFGITMLVAVGPKAPLDYSVFTASAAALSLALLSDRRSR